MQVIQLRWNGFYNLLMIWDDKTRKNFFKVIKKIESFKEKKILQILESKEEQEKNKDCHTQMIKLLEDFKFEFDIKLWDLLIKHIDLLKNVKDWNIYRRATEVISESTSLKDYITIDSTPLLKSEGKIFTIPNNISQVDELLNIIYWSFPRNRIRPFHMVKTGFWLINHLG